MPKGSSNTGDPTPYSDQDEGIIEAAFDRAFRDYEAELPPSQMTVRAQIEWGGVLDRANGGIRTTRLNGLNLRGVRAALNRVNAAERSAAEARPATSYRAKGWHAQLRELTGSRRGSELAERAGLDPSARTLQRWLAGGQPSRANRERIAEAYEGLRTWRVDQARGEVQQARHELSGELSDALRERYGQEIRLRDIRTLRLNR